MDKQERLILIKGIQEKRQSKLISHMTSDSAILTFLTAGNTPRFFYDHLIPLGNKIPRLDLFLYSVG